ncbi:unnamed protein product [Trichobilharzia regenti]|nr:unnamed protein product [Trichobilharzia regenti]
MTSKTERCGCSYDNYYNTKNIPGTLSQCKMDYSCASRANQHTSTEDETSNWNIENVNKFSSLHYSSDCSEQLFSRYVLTVLLFFF